VRMSEDRVHVVAVLIAEKLLDDGAVAEPENRNLFIQKITAWIIDDLKTEDEIDREARRILQSYSRPIEEGSEEWDILFRKTREELADRKGYVL
jgi:hypothetical protein